MAILPILRYPDPHLRSPCKPVETFDGRLAALADDLAATMRAAPGIGITAAHVGIAERLTVIELDGPASAPTKSATPLRMGFAVWGSFSRGDTVSIYGTNGREIARGLAGYDADEARLIVGRKSAEIAAVLGYAGRSLQLCCVLLCCAGTTTRLTSGLLASR